MTDIPWLSRLVRRSDWRIVSSSYETPEIGRFKKFLADFCRDSDWRNAYTKNGFELTKAESELSGKGFLLEKMIAMMLRCLGCRHLALQVKLMDQRGFPTQEDDVLFLNNNELVFVDCKSGSVHTFSQRAVDLIGRTRSYSAKEPRVIVISTSKEHTAQQKEFLKGRAVRPMMIGKNNFHEVPLVLCDACNGDRRLAEEFREIIQEHWNPQFGTHVVSPVVGSIRRMPQATDSPDSRGRMQDLRGTPKPVDPRDCRPQGASSEAGQVQDATKGGARASDSLDPRGRMQDLRGTPKPVESRDHRPQVASSAIGQAPDAAKGGARASDSLDPRGRMQDSGGSSQRLNPEGSCSLPSSGRGEFSPRLPKNIYRDQKTVIKRYGRLLLLDESKHIGKIIFDEKTESSLLCFPEIFETGDRVCAEFVRDDISAIPTRLSVENEEWSYGEIILNYGQFMLVRSHYPVIRELIYLPSEEISESISIEARVPRESQSFESGSDQKKVNSSSIKPVPIRFRLHKKLIPKRKFEFRDTFEYRATQAEPVRENSPDYFKTRSAVFGQIEVDRRSFVRGVVKYYNPEKRFGFIDAENGESIHFLEGLFQQLYGEDSVPQVGDIVIFSVSKQERGLTVRQFFSDDTNAQPTEGIRGYKGFIRCPQSSFKNFLSPTAGKVYYAFSTDGREANEVYEADSQNIAHCIACVKDRALHPSLKIPFMERVIAAKLSAKNLTPADLEPEYRNAVGQMISDALEQGRFADGFAFECLLQRKTPNWERLAPFKEMAFASLGRFSFDAPIVRNNLIKGDGMGWHLEFSPPVVGSDTVAHQGVGWELQFDQPTIGEGGGCTPLSWNLQFNQAK